MIKEAFYPQSIEDLFSEAGFVSERWGAERQPPPSAAPLVIDHEILATVAWHCIARLV